MKERVGMWTKFPEEVSLALPKVHGQTMAKNGFQTVHGSSFILTTIAAYAYC